MKVPTSLAVDVASPPPEEPFPSFSWITIILKLKMIIHFKFSFPLSLALNRPMAGVEKGCLRFGNSFFEKTLPPDVPFPLTLLLNPIMILNRCLAPGGEGSRKRK
jgi:hypothetical protein